VTPCYPQIRCVITLFLCDFCCRAKGQKSAAQLSLMQKTRRIAPAGSTFQT
jgi:hypothetical protein